MRHLGYLAMIAFSTLMTCATAATYRATDDVVALVAFAITIALALQAPSS